MRKMNSIKLISKTISSSIMHTWLEYKVSHNTLLCEKVCRAIFITTRRKSRILRLSMRMIVFSSNSQDVTWLRPFPSICIRLPVGRGASHTSQISKPSTLTWRSCTVKNRTVSKSNSKKKYRMRNGLCRTRNGHLGWVSRRQPESRIEIII